MYSTACRVDSGSSFSKHGEEMRKKLVKAVSPHLWRTLHQSLVVNITCSYWDTAPPLLPSLQRAEASRSSVLFFLSFHLCKPGAHRPSAFRKCWRKQTTGSNERSSNDPTMSWQPLLLVASVSIVLFVFVYGSGQSFVHLSEITWGWKHGNERSFLSFWSAIPDRARWCLMQVPSSPAGDILVIESVFTARLGMCATVVT